MYDRKLFDTDTMCSDGVIRKARINTSNHCAAVQVYAVRGWGKLLENLPHYKSKYITVTGVIVGGVFKPHGKNKWAME